MKNKGEEVRKLRRYPDPSIWTPRLETAHQSNFERPQVTTEPLHARVLLRHDQLMLGHGVRAAVTQRSPLLETT